MPQLLFMLQFLTMLSMPHLFIMQSMPLLFIMLQSTTLFMPLLIMLSIKLSMPQSTMLLSTMPQPTMPQPLPTISLIMDMKSQSTTALS
jgi:hypothetical protein